MQIYGQTVRNPEKTDHDRKEGTKYEGTIFTTGYYRRRNYRGCEDPAKRLDHYRSADQGIRTQNRGILRYTKGCLPEFRYRLYGDDTPRDGNWSRRRSDYDCIHVYGYLQLYLPCGGSSCFSGYAARIL